MATVSGIGQLTTLHRLLQSFIAWASIAPTAGLSDREWQDQRRRIRLLAAEGGGAMRRLALACALAVCTIGERRPNRGTAGSEGLLGAVRATVSLAAEAIGCLPTSAGLAQALCVERTVQECTIR